jgi:hypothetical protein
MRYQNYKSLPPAARGGSFCKNRPPWTPLQKLLINEKFLGVQNPFFKKGFGRRRYKKLRCNFFFSMLK